MEQTMENNLSKIEISSNENKDFGINIKDWAIISVISLVLGLLLSWGGMMAEAISTGPIAATVNGTPIYENEITKTIANLRQSQGGQDNKTWESWLSNNGYTPESLRQLAIDSSTSSVLLEQAAKEYNIEVSDEEVATKYASEAKMYGGEEAFKTMLASASMTPNDYKKQIKLGLTSKALADAVLSEPTISDEQVLEIIKASYPDMVDENTQGLSDLDPSLVSYIRKALTANARQTEFTTWFNDYKSKADIVVNDMPEDLSYDTASTGK